MRVFRSFILVLATVTLGGCTVFDSFSEVNALNEVQPSGSAFTQGLASGYRDFANNELRDMFDYPDALHFARKGLAAAAGNNVLPEPVSDWNLDDGQIQELNAARGRLIVAFDLGARENMPDKTAMAQVRFDCWIEQSEEDDADAQACRNEFSRLMDEIEANLQPPREAPVMEVPVQPEMAQPVQPVEMEPAEPMAPEDAVYLVFFNWDSAELGSGALNVLDAVADEVRGNTPNLIKIVGHADTSGTEAYNQKLSFRRAVVVRDALAQRGVPEAIMQIDSRGENDLLVPTSDNVREPANRRTNISFE